MPSIPPPSFQRSEVNPRAARLFGGIPVTNRNVWCPNGFGSGGTAGTDYSWWLDANLNGTYRTKHYLAYDATGLRLVYANSGQDPTGAFGAESGPAGSWASTVLGGTLTVQATLEYQLPAASGPVFQPVFFQGKLNGTVDCGGILVSDPINIDCRISSHRDLYVRTWVQAPTGVYWPLHQTQNGGDGEGFTSNVNKCPIGSIQSFTVQANGAFAPLMILGYTSPINRPVLGVIGDSIVTGIKNRNKDGATQGLAVAGVTEDRSYIDNANGLTTPAVPLVKLCRGSLTAQAEASANTSNNSYWKNNRFLMLQQCTHSLIALATNDIFNGRTANQIESDLTTICSYHRLLGIKPYLATIVPRTTSSDNWATAGNQTVDANDAVRVAVNTWIRGTAVSTGVCDGYVDVASAVEVNASNVLTPNGGRWLTNGTAKHYVDDGVHGAYDGNLTMGNSTALQNFISLVSSWTG